MATGDIPKIPHEYKLRMKELSAKIKAGEITPEEVRDKALTVLGKVKIDAEGVLIKGDYGRFEVDERIITAAQEFLMYAYELVPKLLGKAFLIKKGDDFKKIVIGFGLMSSSASEKDIKNSGLPIVEYVQDPLTEKKKIKIHRIEEFAGWLGEDWEGGALMFKLAIPLSDLLTKEVLDKLNDSMEPFCDLVLKECGV